MSDPRTRVVFVVAHPDDEVIGAGGSLLSRFEQCQVVHVTDGAPSDDAHPDFNTRGDYAHARREETIRALALAGISESQLIELGVRDQQTSYQLVSVVQGLAKLLREIEPEIVITHSYEGGHPDHDATAFAVHFAVRLLLDEKTTAPEVFEMTSYHRRDETVVYSDFLPREGSMLVTFALAEHEKSLKRKMFECFQTQPGLLYSFPIEVERFRKAPSYDFSQPPHAGKLHHEYFDWGMPAEKWLTLAREALVVLQQGGTHGAHDLERGVSVGSGGPGRGRRSRTDTHTSRRGTR